MANADSLSQQTADAVSNYRLASIRATLVNTSGSGAIKLPLLSGGLTNGGAVANSGGVIVRRVTVQNPSGSISSANISVGLYSNGANLITSNTVLSSVSAVGTFQDISPTATFVSGANTSCLFVNVNTASGNNNTVDIVVWGDVISF